MKNKKIGYMILACCILLVSACKKGYLDKLPDDRISEGEVFGNINNAEGFVNNIYNALPSWSSPSNGASYSIAAATDEAKQAWANGFIIFNLGSWNASNLGPLSNEWFKYYNAIRKCNTFLEKYNEIPEDPDNVERKTRLKGEVYTLRAYFYFTLFKEFGEIPLLNTPVSAYGDESKFYLKRSSYEDVVNFIIKDLDSAEQLLPYTYTNKSFYGRATKMVDLAIQSRVLLFYASPLFNPGNNKSLWQNAATASKEALDAALANGYDLSNNYANIFLDYANPEVIWSRPMGNGDGGTGIGQVMQPLGYGGWGNSGPIQEFVDSYEMQSSGLPINNPSSGYDPKHPYIGRDPRFYATILYPGEVWKGRRIDPNGPDAPTPGQISPNYWWRKYISESGNLYYSSGFVDKKWVLFRTAELYLNYAEAQNEANGPDASVHQAINTIRHRAGMPDIPINLSQAEMRNTIRHERKIEMAFEGNRFWDVRRWEMAEVVDNGPVHGVDMTVNQTDTTYTYPIIQTRVFEAPKDYLLPVPQNEIDKMAGKNPKFKQTPGW